MRVTGGIGKGRRLAVPSGGVRPTSDKVKQALFNILGERIMDAAFLDLFAGAGGIGIEALSRGAGNVTFVDASRASLDSIRKNIALTGFNDRALIVTKKAEAFLSACTDRFDIVFLDPPYAQELAPLLEKIAASSVLKPGGVVVAEHFKKQLSPVQAGVLALVREAKYGDTVLAFYKMQGAGDRDQGSEES